MREEPKENAARRKRFEQVFYKTLVGGPERSDIDWLPRFGKGPRFPQFRICFFTHVPMSFRS